MCLWTRSSWRLLRGRRAPELFAGGRPARGHPARCQPADPLARAAVGQQLLDRSGRRVEPTEAGLRLYRGAQRLLALEQQLLAELGEEAEGELEGRLEIGASTGPGGSVLPVLLGEFQRLHPAGSRRADVSDTHTVVEQVGRRELELGVVGAGGRQRGVSFEPFYRDEVVLAVPAGHPRAGKSMTLDELKASRSCSCRRAPASGR